MSKGDCGEMKKRLIRIRSLGAQGGRARSFLIQMIALFLGLAALSGCTTTSGRLPKDLPGEYVPLTRPIILVGDNQEHESTGFPLHQNDGAVDAYVEVAQRPPEQPLFGRNILQWVIDHHPDTPMLHLGDMLDMSCLSEEKRLLKVLGKAKQPVAIIPGNHDGLLFGIFNRDILSDYLNADGLEWQRGCRHGAEDDDSPHHKEGRGPGLNKRQFIGSYIEFLASDRRRRPGLKPPPDFGIQRVVYPNPNPDAFVERLEANLVGGRNYAQSYIVQKLRLPAAPGAPRRVTIIAIDTAQLNVAIGYFNMLLGRSPGDMGRVLSDQAKVIAKFVEDAKKAGEMIIFAGHHSWGQLDPGSRWRLQLIMDRVEHPLVYLSAHTHEGSWQIHRLGDRSLLDLNVSSLADWPLAYRRVSFAYDQRANRVKVFADLLPSQGSPPKNDAELLEAWTRPSCSQAGVPIEKIVKEDLAAVKAQKESRGSLVGWLFEGILGNTEAGKQKLYESAHRYQDGMLEIIIETFDDLGGQVQDLSRVNPPAFCDGQNVRDCASSLRAAKYDTLPSTVETFRQKAAFVDFVGDQLEEIDDPRLDGYMVCRTAFAAKDDHDLIPEGKQPGASESKRGGRGFFQIEATVGMD
jgi:hypothetical protein